MLKMNEDNEVQGEDRANDILDWRIKGVEEGQSLGNHRKKMGKDFVYLQIAKGGLE
jgi:hypothetical protein